MYKNIINVTRTTEHIKRNIHTMIDNFKIQQIMILYTF